MRYQEITKAPFGEPNPRIRKQVEVELVGTAYENLYTVLATSVINSVLVAAIASRYVGPVAPLAWVAALWALCAARLVLGRRYARRETNEPVDRWASRFTAGSIASGILWGIGGGLLYVPDAFVYQVLLSFVLGGMVAGAAVTISAVPRAFIGYLIPSLSPLIIRLIVEGDPIHLVMGSLMAVYAVAVIFIGRMSTSRLTVAYRLWFENRAMVQELAEARDELSSLNATLENRVAQRTAALHETSLRREQAERDLMQAHKVEAVGRLSSGLAHDFNNLLTVVRGSLEGALDGLDKSDRTRQSVATGLGAIERGRSLIGGLLAYSQKRQICPEIVSPDQFLRRRMQRLARLVVPENIEIEWLLGDTNAELFVDESLLELSLLNLILNARDAMPHGGRLTIESERVVVGSEEADAAGDAIEPGEFVRLTVADTGGGIGDEQLTHVVKPFFTTKEIGVGSGLGLSLVSGFVQEARGRLVIRSTVDVGTTVQLLLPLREGTQDGQPSVIRQWDRATTLDQDFSGTILFVEDDPDVRSVVVPLLESRGCDVRVASSGAEAIELLGQMGGVNVLFTDIVMPGAIDGVALAKHTKEHFPSTRVILTTGYAPELAMTADQAWPVVMKPYSVDHLLTAIQRANSDATSS